MRNHVIRKIEELAAQDERIVLLTGDLGFGVLEQFSQNFPDRYINCGISEQNMAAVSAGLALEGNIVFLYSIANFPTMRCLEQLRNDVCYHNANVKILATGGGFAYGTSGMTHHATEDIAIMRALPNMRVYSPADYIEAEAALFDAYHSANPCYIRLARGSDPVFWNNSLPKRITKIQPFLLEETPDHPIALILTTGSVLNEGVAAMKLLNDRGIPTALYTVPTIKPFDEESIRVLSKDVKIICTVEEHQAIGGLGGAVAEALVSDSAGVPLKRIGLCDTYTEYVGDQAWLRKKYHIDQDTIVKTISDYLC